jgi:peptidoglycan/LPS O-acetylase OafA/YrhL
VSMAGKLYASKHGLNLDPWNYRFFPFELMYFLAGSLSYIIYKKFIENNKLPKYVYLSVFIGMVLFTTLASFIHLKSIGPLYCLFVFIAIPFLFKFTKKFKFDRFIGELSYPIYLTHILILNLVRTAGITKYQNIATIIGSIIISIILVKLVGDRLENLRQGRVKNQKGVDKIPDALAVKFNN